MERIVSLFRECGIEDIHAVVGHRAEDLSPLLKKLEVSIVSHPDFHQGMYSSIRAGARSIRPACPGFFIMPVDIPLVRPHTLRLILKAQATDPDAIFHPSFLGRRGHPPLLPGPMARRLVPWDGDGGLRAFFTACGTPERSVAVADRNILFDVDSPEDYRELETRWKQRHVPSPEECEAILATVPESVARHSRKVAETAGRIGDALAGSGLFLDPDLIRAAALLHDIARGEKDHARKGGRLLTEMGFRRVGDIVAMHTDLKVPEAGSIDEASVVFLADKLVLEDHPVSLTARFDRSRKRFAGAPHAMKGLEDRHLIALTVKGRVESRLGRSLENLLNHEAG